MTTGLSRCVLGVSLELVQDLAFTCVFISGVARTPNDGYLSYLPLFMMRDAVRSGRISALPVRGFAPTTPFGLIHGVSAMSDPLVRAFADTIKTHLAAAESELFHAFPHLAPQ